MEKFVDNNSNISKKEVYFRHNTLKSNISGITTANSTRTGDSRTVKTTTTSEDRLGLSSFSKLPPFESFNKVGWVLLGCQFLTGILGAFFSYISQVGAIGGVMSGIMGLWFVQMTWVMSLPSKCSVLPFRLGLAFIPLSKSVGFLLVPGTEGYDSNWPEFLRRIVILTFLWVIPMWLAGSTTAEVVRATHGDISRYSHRNKSQASHNIFAAQREEGFEIDEDCTRIRERAMECTVKYILVLPIVVFFTFNSVGALMEATEYEKYITIMDGDFGDFETHTGRQFYMDFIRQAQSNIYQGLVAVFTLLSISAFSCSGLDFGEIMVFRFDIWEFLAFIVNILFFVAGVFFGSPVFQPLNKTQGKISYWTVFVLPCLLVLCLWRLTNSVLHNKNILRDKRMKERQLSDLTQDGGSFRRSLFGRSTSNLFGRSSSNLFGGSSNLYSIPDCASVDVAKEDKNTNAMLLARIEELEKTAKVVNGQTAHNEKKRYNAGSKNDVTVTV